MKADTIKQQPVANFSRRGFLIGAAAGSLVVATGFRSAIAEESKNLTEDTKKFGGDGMPHGLRDDPHLFIAIAPDGGVTFTSIRQDMGQGIRTSLALVAADELGADMGRVRVQQAPANEERYGNQDTDGSRSMRQHFMAIRRAGAAARAMLETAAAAKWSVPIGEVSAVNHELVHRPSGRKIGFGEVADAASKLPAPSRDDLKLKNPSEFRYIGKGNVHLVDGFDITVGKATYGIDAKLPGMLHAVVAHPPVYLGKVKSYDASETMKIPGVLKVVQIDGTPPPSEFNPVGGLAVIAKNTWAAMKGRDALKIVWDDGPNASYNSEPFRKAMEETNRKPQTVARKAGDVGAALNGAKDRLVAEYYAPHLAQAPMEPPAAVVRIVDGKCEAWACVQAPQATRDLLAKRLGLSSENVAVNVTLLGGGFGRKSKPDFVIEAGLCSKAMDGAPVQVLWTREDDLQHAFYHTVSAERLEGGLDAQGKTVAWLHRSTAPTIASTFAAGMKNESATELGMGLINLPFDIPNMSIENGEAEAHTRIGWFRSVSNIPHAFAIQSFVAELADKAGRDPKDYLLELIGAPRQINPRSVNDGWNHGEDPARYPIDTGRLRAVTERAAKEIGWGRQLTKGTGLGIAAHYSFVTYVAVAMEVAVSDKGDVTINRLDIAADCGPQVNPDRITSQFEGAAIMGLTLTNYGAITFKNGVAQQSNFDTYQMARIDTVPKDIRVHLVGGGDWNQPLGGVGEPGVPPIAPALCNAIFAASKKRIRSLPIGDQLRV